MDVQQRLQPRHAAQLDDQLAAFGATNVDIARAYVYTGSWISLIADEN
jgi:hypothetical protein